MTLRLEVGETLQKATNSTLMVALYTPENENPQIKVGAQKFKRLAELLLEQDSKKVINPSIPIVIYKKQQGYQLDGQDKFLTQSFQQALEKAYNTRYNIE